MGTSDEGRGRERGPQFSLSLVALRTKMLQGRVNLVLETSVKWERGHYTQITPKTRLYNKI